MSKRLSISVPDTLRAEMDKYKDRINFSKVCSDALREELARLVEEGGDTLPDYEDVQVGFRFRDCQGVIYEARSWDDGILIARRWSKKYRQYQYESIDSGSWTVTGYYKPYAGRMK
jgi:hypothetical protein